ncbi:mCG146129 [Mus musculus]|nr:mCG146129 [Mus musculus]
MANFFVLLQQGSPSKALPPSFSLYPSNWGIKSIPAFRYKLIKFVSFSTSQKNFTKMKGDGNVCHGTWKDSLKPLLDGGWVWLRFNLITISQSHFSPLCTHPTLQSLLFLHVLKYCL